MSRKTYTVAVQFNVDNLGNDFSYVTLLGSSRKDVMSLDRYYAEIAQTYLQMTWIQGRHFFSNYNFCWKMNDMVFIYHRQVNNLNNVLMKISDCTSNYGRRKVEYIWDVEAGKKSSRDKVIKIIWRFSKSYIGWPKNGIRVYITEWIL